MKSTNFPAFGFLACLFINVASSRFIDGWSHAVTCQQNNRSSFQPHPFNYNLFIFCNGLSTKPHLLRCREGQLFDSVLGLCVKAENASCKNGGSTRVIPVEGYRPIKNGFKSKGNIICIQNDSESILQHPTNCSRFYRCIEGNAVEMECPPGMHFDRVSRSCGPLRNGICNIAPPIDHGRSDEDECEIPQCPPYNWGNVVQFYNPLNCSEFFKCNWGIPKKFYCPPGLEYNRRLQVCDFPYLADCHLCTES